MQPCDNELIKEEERDDDDFGDFSEVQVISQPQISLSKVKLFSTTQVHINSSFLEYFQRREN